MQKSSKKRGDKNIFKNSRYKKHVASKIFLKKRPAKTRAAKNKNAAPKILRVKTYEKRGMAKNAQKRIEKVGQKPHSQKPADKNSNKNEQKLVLKIADFRKKRHEKGEQKAWGKKSPDIKIIGEKARSWRQKWH